MSRKGGNHLEVSSCRGLLHATACKLSLNELARGCSNPPIFLAKSRWWLLSSGLVGVGLGHKLWFACVVCVELLWLQVYDGDRVVEKVDKGQGSREDAELT